MKHIFGPVPSRRLGQSLGIDPIPFKTCNWNCVYCQLGRKAPLSNERREFFPAEEIVAEAEAALQAHAPFEIDWVTFVGSGEPTLHARLGWMIRQVKTFTRIPVAVATNCSLLDRPEVRDDLMAADAVLASVDAGTEALHRVINRPFPGLTLERLIEGLVAFREMYAGKLWTEVMLIKAQNDSEAALRDIKQVLSCIHPDEVHITVPFRPPAEPWVQPADGDALCRAKFILGDIAKVTEPISDTFDLSGFSDVVDAVLAVISRHPMEEEQLMRTLNRWTPGQVGQALAKLSADARAQVVSRFGRRFWSYAKAGYGAHASAGKHGHAL
jgi:wyosine [tRNA(Phe)-imidazoG37] synthetase (radical SAM superfamily)